MKKILTLAMMALAFAVPAVAVNNTDAPTFEDVWARATVGTSRTTAVYGVLRNVAADDVLLKAHADVAKVTQIHNTFIDEAGLMQMREVEGINLESGTHVVLQTGGLHIMLMGLEKALEPGDEFMLSLEFKNAGTKLVRVPVKPIRYMPDTVDTRVDQHHGMHHH